MRIMSGKGTGIPTVFVSPVVDMILRDLTAEHATAIWLAGYAVLVASPDYQAETVKVMAYFPRRNFNVPGYGNPLALLEGTVTGAQFVLFLDPSGRSTRIVCYQIAPDMFEIVLDESDFTPVS
jgi:hypothetical protein